MNTQQKDEYKCPDGGCICDLCGKWDSNLTKGVCEECRKKYEVSKDDAEFKRKGVVN